MVALPTFLILSILNMLSAMLSAIKLGIGWFVVHLEYQDGRQ